MSAELNHRGALFWDVPEEAIEKTLAESPDWVILRVFQYGTVADIEAVISLYGKEKTSAVLRETRMKPVTRAMAYLFLGLDPEGYYVV